MLAEERLLEAAATAPVHRLAQVREHRHLAEPCEQLRPGCTEEPRGHEVGGQPDLGDAVEPGGEPVTHVGGSARGDVQKEVARGACGRERQPVGAGAQQTRELRPQLVDVDGALG